MGVPRHLPPPSGPGRSPGRGPFGEKAFRGALVLCAVLVVLGPLMLWLGGDSARAVGTAFLVLGALGLVTGGGGLLLEAAARRRSPRAPPPPPPPPPDLVRRNGRGPHPPELPKLPDPSRRTR